MRLSPFLAQNISGLNLSPDFRQSYSPSHTRESGVERHVAGPVWPAFCTDAAVEERRREDAQGGLSHLQWWPQSMSWVCRSELGPWGEAVLLQLSKDS